MENYDKILEELEYDLIGKYKTVPVKKYITVFCIISIMLVLLWPYKLRTTYLYYILTSVIVTIIVLYIKNYLDVNSL